MPQTLRGDVIRNDNIAVGLVCGTENAVAVTVPAPALPIENVSLGFGPCPYNVERIAVGVLGPNPEIP